MSISPVSRQFLLHPVSFSHIPSSSPVSHQVLPYRVKFSRIPLICSAHPVNFLETAMMHESMSVCLKAYS